MYKSTGYEIIYNVSIFKTAALSYKQTFGKEQKFENINLHLEIQSIKGIISIQEGKAELCNKRYLG